MYKPKVRLTGTDGNAFAIVGEVSKALRSAGYSKEDVDLYVDESFSSESYDALLRVAMKWAEVS